MNQNLFNKNLSQSINLKNDDSASRFKLGGSIFLCPIFDIKKYMNNAQIYERSAKKEKYKLPPLLNSLQKGPKYDVNKSEIHTIANEHLPSYKRNFFSVKKKTLDKSTTITNNNNSITAKNSDNRSYTLNDLNITKDNNHKIYETINFGENTKSKKYLDLESNSKSIDTPKKNNIFTVKGENLNLLKIIKNIKKEVDTAHKDRSLKNIMNNKIAYSQKYSDLVFKPIRIINDYNNFQQRDLDKNRGDISNFISDNKDISKRNLLIKLLEKQKRDYYKAIDLRQKSIDSSRRTIEIDENNYECYTMNQKQACRRIEKMLNNLNVKYRRLYNEEKKFRTELRIREDERQKLLEQIDEYRIIAKFVSKVLESHINLFKIKIIPDYNSDELPDYEKISDEVCKRYSFLLDEEQRENNQITQEGIDIIKEMKDLSDSELYHQFHKMEDNIVNSLKLHDEISKEVLILQRERKKQSDDFAKRIKNLEDEFEYYISSYDREKVEYEDICHRNETGNFELGEIAIDLYHGVMDIFKVGKKDEESNQKKKLISVNNALLETQRKIIEKEEQLKKLIATMESYEKSNKWLFYRVVHIRKNENKELKFNIMKQIIEAGEKEKMLQKSPEEKIVFIRRKAEPSYHEPKKDKEVKIDPNLVRQVENEELMSYK